MVSPRLLILEHDHSRVTRLSRPGVSSLADPSKFPAPNECERQIHPVDAEHLISLILQRIVLWILQSINFQIDVKVRPIQMVPVQQLNVKDFSYLGIPKPRIVIVRHEVLSVIHAKPKTMIVDVGHFNL